MEGSQQNGQNIHQTTPTSSLPHVTEAGAPQAPGSPKPQKHNEAPSSPVDPLSSSLSAPQQQPQQQPTTSSTTSLPVLAPPPPPSQTSSTPAPPNIVNQNTKRTNYICWEDYFMSVAYLSAQRSKDPSSQVGACIVNRDNKIVAIGYNGMPNGVDDEKVPWGRTGSFLDTKYPYVCHAEMNAILNKNSADLHDCIIYVAMFPCNECAKLIIQSGISLIYYTLDKYHDKDEYIASRRLLDLAGIKYIQYRPRMKRITIDFSALFEPKAAPSEGQVRLHAARPDPSTLAPPPAHPAGPSSSTNPQSPPPPSAQPPQQGISEESKQDEEGGCLLM